MHYLIFLAIPLVYNFLKFRKERSTFVASLKEIKNSNHHEMVLSHHFTIFFTEVIVAFTVPLFVFEKDHNLFFILCIYGLLAIFSYFIFVLFIKYLEKHTELDLLFPFKNKLFKEVRVNGLLVLLPFVLFQFLYFSLSDDVIKDWGSWWFVGIFANFILITVATIVCTVILLLKLIPNREITEPEFLEIINQRLSQIGYPKIRLRWIETDFKNAFVIGIKLLRFSNETMFIGKTLRERFSLEEFDAVICHEIAHIVNKHYQKRVLITLKSYFFLCISMISFLLGSFLVAGLLWREHSFIHSSLLLQANLAFFVLATIYVFYSTFRISRMQEYEADAYAVMKLGANVEALKTALEKLTINQDLPEYLKAKKEKYRPTSFTKWYLKLFGTHPEVNERIQFIREKIDQNLSFDYQPSLLRKMKSIVISWRFYVPAVTGLFIFIFTLYHEYQSNQQLLVYVQTASREELLKNEELAKKINDYPSIFGPNFMSYVIVKNDPVLIDHFLKQGANKWMTLYYISQYKKSDLFRKSFSNLEKEITKEEYFYLLKYTAKNETMDIYHFLLTSSRASELSNAEMKTLAASLKAEAKRLPASIQK